MAPSGQPDRPGQPVGAEAAPAHAAVAERRRVAVRAGAAVREGGAGGRRPGRDVTAGDGITGVEPCLLERDIRPDVPGRRVAGADIRVGRGGLGSHPRVGAGEGPVTAADGNPVDPSLAWTGLHYALAWTDHRTGLPQIWFARLTPDGDKVGDDVQLTHAPEGAQEPSLVWTGTDYAVAYAELYQGEWRRIRLLRGTFHCD